MRKNYLLYFIAMSALIGCSDSALPTEVQFDSSINGKIITIIPDYIYSLELDLSADAGCRWDYSISDTTVLGIDSTSYRPKSGNWNQCGGMTIETFYFRGKRSGKCFVMLIEHQPWMKDAPPNNIVQFSVIVK